MISENALSAIYGEFIDDDERAQILLGILETWLRRTIGRDVTYFYICHNPQERLNEFIHSLSELNIALDGLSRLEALAELIKSKIRFASSSATLRGCHIDGLIYEPQWIEDEDFLNVRAALNPTKHKIVCPLLIKL